MPGEAHEETMEEGMPRRMYPDAIPPAEGHPTGDRFEIIEMDDGRGHGMKAKVAFARGERVARVSGVLVDSAMLDTIQVAPGVRMYDTWFCRYLLHSCAPNLVFDPMRLEMWATRDIAPGEDLTLDYAITEEDLVRQFACACGAPECRGWIMGRRESPTEEGRRVLAARAARD